MDGSNAWPDSSPRDAPGEWEDKQPYSHAVHVHGQQFLVWRFPRAGGMIPPHSHPYEHDSILLQGTVTLTGDHEGRNGIRVTAPDTVFFKPGVSHSIKALTDNVIMIHVYPFGTDVTDAS